MHFNSINAKPTKKGVWRHKVLVMKIWNYLAYGLIGLLVLFSCAAPARAGQPQPPMVEKHMFSPALGTPGAMKKKKSPMTGKLEREILFTGVIISPQGRRAMMRERMTPKGERQSILLKEGDEIRGMTIKKIGINFVVLAGEGEEVRLNLYQGEKKRPAPPALSRVKGGASRTSAVKRPDKKLFLKKGNTFNRRRKLPKMPINEKASQDPEKQGQKGP